MLVFPKNAEKNASTIEKGLDGSGGLGETSWVSDGSGEWGLVRHHGSLSRVGAG